MKIIYLLTFICRRIRLLAQPVNCTLWLFCSKALQQDERLSSLRHKLRRPSSLNYLTLPQTSLLVVCADIKEEERNKVWMIFHETLQYQKAIKDVAQGYTLRIIECTLPSYRYEMLQRDLAWRYKMAFFPVQPQHGNSRYELEILFNW